MNGQTNEAHSIAQLQFLAHVETIIRDRVCAAIKQHELEKSHVLSGYERDIGDLRTRCTELEALIHSGFPAGDAEAHCRVHQGYIDDVLDRRKRVSSITTNIFQAGILGTVVFVGNAIWESIKGHLK